MVRFKKTFFTLLEVIVAMAVLSLCLISAMSLAALSVSRAEKAKSKWEKRHMLTQAAEFFLLYGSDAAITDEFFSWSGYRAFCALEEPENLPDGVEASAGKWKLAGLKVTLLDDRGNEIDSIVVEKILRQDTQ